MNPKMLFLLLVHAGAVIRDIHKGMDRAMPVIGHAARLPDSMFESVTLEDIESMAIQLISWQYGESESPDWLPM